MLKILKRKAIEKPSLFSIKKPSTEIKVPNDFCERKYILDFCEKHFLTFDSKKLEELKKYSLRVKSGINPGDIFTAKIYGNNKSFQKTLTDQRINFSDSMEKVFYPSVIGLLMFWSIKKHFFNNGFYYMAVNHKENLPVGKNGGRIIPCISAHTIGGFSIEMLECFTGHGWGDHAHFLVFQKKI